MDGLGRLRSIQPEGGFATYRVEAPPTLWPLLVEKGSLGVDGVSLTVSQLHEDGCSMALIPETLTRTTLGLARAGDELRLEADLIAKHVARLMEFARSPRPG